MKGDVVRDLMQRAYANGDTVHVDGWTSVHGRNTFAQAEKLGYVSSFENVIADQYTAINYTITPKGRKYLEHDHAG